MIIHQDQVFWNHWAVYLAITHLFRRGADCFLLNATRTIKVLHSLKKQAVT